MTETTELIVGRAIKRLRKQKGLSLRELSSLCGLSTTAISKIERGENSPTVASLHLLSSALEVPIMDFFRQQIRRDVVFVKASEVSRLRSGGVEIESLGASLPFQKLEPLKLTISQGNEHHAEFVSHSGEEFVYCLKGKVEYTIDEQVYLLEPGDRLVFKAEHPHCYRAIGTEDAEILLVLEASNTQQNPHTT